MIGSYMDAAALAKTGADQLELTDASIKRLMAAGFTAAVPNVARLTGVNVAKRTLAPTRYLAFAALVAGGGDIVGAIDAALVGVGAFPLQVFSNQLAADRAETEGDYIAGVQIDIAVTASLQSNSLLISSATLSDDIEQLMGELYGLAIFPSSGVQSPLVANTPLREFGQTHRLAGPDGYRGTPPVRWSDNFAHIDVLQSPNATNTGARPVVLLNGAAATDSAEISGVIAVRLRTFAG
jgi:hypothetical protein